VRLVSWIFVLCALASATGIFMPSLELRAVRIQRANVSLYELGSHRALAARVIAAYHKSRGRALGEALVGIAAKHTKNEYLGDATDAMSTLDDISDQDVRTLGTVLVVVIWGYLGVQVVMGLLVLGSLVGDVYRKRRLVLVSGLAVLSTAIAVGLLVVCREAAWEANDEIGHTVLGAGVGPYLMVVASAIGLVAIVAVLIGHVRAARVAASGQPLRLTP
jgi:hypothetical protein